MLNIIKYKLCIVIRYAFVFFAYFESKNYREMRAVLFSFIFNSRALLLLIRVIRVFLKQKRTETESERGI